MSLWLPELAVSLVHQSTNQPEAQKPTWHDRTCASPTWSHRLEKAFWTGLFCNRRAQSQPHFSTLVVLESLSLWLEYSKLVSLVLWPLWMQFSRWTLESVAFCAPRLLLVARAAPLPLVQGFPLPARRLSSLFSSSELRVGSCAQLRGEHSGKLENGCGAQEN